MPSITRLLAASAAFGAATVLATSENDANLQRHEIIQRSVEDGTWALETRGLLDDLGVDLKSCDGCQVSDCRLSPLTK